jgi:hypothetical protein
LPFLVLTGDNEPIRQMMSDHGWRPRSPREPNETARERAQRDELDLKNSKGAECVDGRGGHIQNRIVGELPHDVNQGARVRILRGFADWFEERKLPYVAVMHAPDYQNNDKNWHFHLAYYERPCAPFTGNRDDYLDINRCPNNVRDLGIFEKKLKAFAKGELDQFVGQLDFTVPVTHKTKCSHTRTSYPFKQDKDRDCNHRDFPLMLRKRLASITNDELQRAGLSRRVDPRCYAEMGINKDADEHLGNKSAQLEISGIPTPIGVSNEAKQWNSKLDSIARDLQARNKTVINQQRRWNQDLDAYGFVSAQKDQLSGLISNWAEARTEANEQRAIGKELTEQVERCKSRALKVLKACKQHIDAIDGGGANVRQNKNRGAYAKRMLEATEHLGGLKILMAGEIHQAKVFKERSRKLENEADCLKNHISLHMAEGSARTLRGLVTPNKAKGAVQRDTLADQLGCASPGRTDGAELQKGPVAQTDAARTLSKVDFDQFAKHVRDNNRRLSNRGQIVLPDEPTNDELSVISAANFADFQPEMRKLKQAQDDGIARLRKHLISHPNTVRLAKIKSLGDEPVHEMLVGDDDLQHTFKVFQSDPSVADAIDAALYAQRNMNQGAALIAATAPNLAPHEARINPVAKAIILDQTLVGVSAPRSSASRPASIMSRINDVARIATPISASTDASGRRYQIDRAALQFHAIDPAELGLDFVQHRLAGIFEEQQREKRRLIGFAKSYPERMIAVAAQPGGTAPSLVELPENAPPALRGLADRYAHHVGFQQEIANVVHGALQASGASIQPTASQKGRNSPSKNSLDLQTGAPVQRTTSDTVRCLREEAEFSSAPPLRVAAMDVSQPGIMREESAEIEASAPDQTFSSPASIATEPKDKLTNPFEENRGEGKQNDNDGDGHTNPNSQTLSDETIVPEFAPARSDSAEQTRVASHSADLTTAAVRESKAIISSSEPAAIPGGTCAQPCASDPKLASPNLPLAHAPDPIASEQAARKAAATQAWEALNVSALTTFDEIYCDKRLLVMRNGEVMFSDSDDAPRHHQLYLAAFQSGARRYYSDQQDDISELCALLRKDNAASIQGSRLLDPVQRENLQAFAEDPALKSALLETKLARASSNAMTAQIQQNKGGIA